MYRSYGIHFALDNGMNRMELASLEHVAEELRYQHSKQAKVDRVMDKANRETADRKAGHLPSCGLLRCDPDCRRFKLDNDRRPHDISRN